MLHYHYSGKGVAFRQQHIVLHLRGLFAGDDLVDPVDVAWNACDSALGTEHVTEADDTNDRPLVIMVFAYEWTSTVALSTTPIYRVCQK